ncbi:MAG: TetR family transcriptional regulator C-terminal domain-containing protein [Prevotella sp.]|jgi:AcrR family transcriptional regulator|nr:TetR-like C-terminal domain-containing protein [Prevotella sp.]MCH4183809.1 TetR family transcriptional regulator C-terminal domain-containing protein [Prevotella sp.]
MDRREKQVKDRLMQAMIILTKEKDWSKITVTDLINQSGVARASFYRNFDNINDLIQYGISEIRSDYWKHVPSASNGFFTKEMLTYTFDYYYKYKDLILSFQQAHLPINFLDILTESMILSYGDMPANSINRYDLYYYAGALYNMVVCWLKDGTKETSSQMAIQFLKCSKTNQ